MCVLLLTLYVGSVFHFLKHPVFQKSWDAVLITHLEFDASKSFKIVGTESCLPLRYRVQMGNTYAGFRMLNCASVTSQMVPLYPGGCGFHDYQKRISYFDSSDHVSREGGSVSGFWSICGFSLHLWMQQRTVFTDVCFFVF